MLVVKHLMSNIVVEPWFNIWTLNDSVMFYQCFRVFKRYGSQNIFVPSIMLSNIMSLAPKIEELHAYIANICKCGYFMHCVNVVAKSY